MYDFLVIGAGSAGAHTAYFLDRAGAKVAVVEQSQIGAGGSGAAGAFISPRIGRGGVLQQWTNKAFRFCVEFYKKSPYFYKTGILRLPKDDESFAGLERFLDVAYEKKEDGFLFPYGGVLKAKEHLQFVLQNIKVFYEEAKPIQKGDYFVVGKLRAKHIILATGAYDSLIDVPYIKIGKTSGVRFDLKSDLHLPYSMHKRVSLSANIDGIVSLGATHTRLGNPPQNPAMLFDEAKKMVGSFTYEIAQMYCGVRSSVNDHLPIVGELIDMQKLPKITNYKKVDLKELPRKGIFIINGLGGRGFVFGPYMGTIVANYLIDKKEIPKELSSDRYFMRFCKKGRV